MSMVNMIFFHFILFCFVLNVHRFISPFGKLGIMEMGDFVCSLDFSYGTVR